MYHNFFTHSSFHVPAIVNSAAMNIELPVSFSVMVSSRYMPSSGIAGSYGSFIPSFSKNLCTVLRSGCIGLHSHQQCESHSRLCSSPPHIQPFSKLSFHHLSAPRTQPPLPTSSTCGPGSCRSASQPPYFHPPAPPSP